MNLSRRDLSLAFAGAMTASGQQRSSTTLPSKMYHHEKIAYTGNDTKKGRRFSFGPNHAGFNIEMHETILAPGTQTHAPHKHQHEEVIIVLEGMVEAYLEGETEVMEPGSVIYFGSNQMHSARNAGKTPSRYYVVELRGSEV